MEVEGILQWTFSTQNRSTGREYGSRGEKGQRKKMTTLMFYLKPSVTLQTVKTHIPNYTNLLFIHFIMLHLALNSPLA
jgi:hypothetical protein